MSNTISDSKPTVISVDKPIARNKKSINEDTWTFIKKEPNRVLTFIKELKQWISDNDNSSFYLFGAGNYMPYVVKLLQKHGIPVSAIVDSFRGGTSFKGIPIIQWSIFLKKLESLNPRFLISAPSVANQIVKQINKSLPNAIIDRCGMEIEFFSEYVPDVEQYRTYLLNNYTLFEEFALSLEDELSQHTLECVLKGRISGDFSYFSACAVGNQYYPNGIIKFSDHELVVELGSFDGTTLRDFIERCPKYYCVYCFEPELRLQPYLEMIRMEEEKKGNRIVLVPKGAWDCEDTLQFYIDDSLTGSSTLAMNYGRREAVEIETITIDKLIHEPITYIKMDIEGVELRALRGAVNQITTYRPKLAICVYHKTNDLLDIWNYLRKIVPGYRFYLRHHEKNNGTETVLYAIP